MQEVIPALRQVVQGIGDYLAAAFGDPAARTVVREKGANDFAVRADLEAQRLAVQALKRLKVGDTLLAEETATSEPVSLGFTPGVTLLLDPLEGTANFAAGVPDFGCTIGAAWEGALQYVAFYAPWHRELFEAARGRGATLNGKPLALDAGPAKLLANMVLGKLHLVFNQWEDVPEREAASCYGRLLGITRNISTCYSDALDLCRVACGRRSGLVFLYREAAPWDIAPALIVEEAGGKVTALDGGPWYAWDSGKLVVRGGVAAAAPALHARLLEAAGPKN
ncbi:MAG: inositol monophosphatase [Chloroflexi bacterium]|nr:inositol monophosphatase [Chloroflexota bacterium]